MKKLEEKRIYVYIIYYINYTIYGAIKEDT